MQSNISVHFQITKKVGSINRRRIKKLGYGVPYLIVYRLGGVKKKAILSTMRIGHGFGHDYRADRVDNLVLSYDTWNRLPKHCTIDDLGAFNRQNSSMISLGEAGEFFLIRRMVKGVEYAKDLDRIFTNGSLEDQDLLFAHAPLENTWRRFIQEKIMRKDERSCTCEN